MYSKYSKKNVNLTDDLTSQWAKIDANMAVLVVLKSTQWNIA